MPQTSEILCRFGSFHRGDVYLQWHRQNAVSAEDMIDMVASEIQGNLRLTCGDVIVPPPDEFCHTFDKQLAEAISRSIPQGEFSGKTYVVAHTLTVTDAVKIARSSYYEHGLYFEGIGCGTLIVPASMGCDRYPLPNTTWMELIDPVPYIPLYQCEMFIVKDLQT